MSATISATISPAAKGYLWAALTGFCWAILAIVLKHTSGFMSTGTIVFVRMFIASLILVLYFLWASPNSFKKIFKAPPLLCFIGALLLAFNYYGYMKGVEMTTASNAQIMIQSGPLMLLFAGVFYFREKLRPLQWLGVLGAILGFTLFFMDQSRFSLADINKYGTGNLWVITGAATWAMFAVFQKVLLKKGWLPSELNLITYFVCALVLIGPADLSELHNTGLKEIFVLIFLGVNTVVAYGGFSMAMSLAPASHVSLIITCNPLLTILLVQLMGFYGLDIIPPEPLGWRGVMGALLVVSGVGLAVGAPFFLNLRRKKGLV